MVRFENVSMSYGESDVLNGIDLHIREGEFTVLIGPSGCGKTTTLQLINRLIVPTGGRILVNGEDIATVDPVELRRGIGYVIQEIGLFPHMTIRQNIEIVPGLLGWDEKRRQARTLELMKLVGMDEKYLDYYPAKLSGGQQQRIGLLRALAVEPPIILMDEPFGALDPITREALQDEILALQKKLKKTVVFVTHDMDEALKLADRIILMKDGLVVQAATPKELLTHPADEFVEAFIGKRRRYSGKLDTVEEVMSHRAVCTGTDTSVAEAVEMMRIEHVPMVFALDENGIYAGQFSIEGIQELNLTGREKVEQFLNRSLPAVRPGDSAKDVFHQMMEGRIDELPVVDGEGRVIGIVTRRSMVMELAGAVWEGDRNE